MELRLEFRLWQFSRGSGAEAIRDIWRVTRGHVSHWAVPFHSGFLKERWLRCDTRCLFHRLAIATMSSIRPSPLIPQHAQLRSLAGAVPLKRSRRGLKNIALLCLGPLCVLLIYFYNGSRASVTTGNIPGGATVEELVRKGREGYQAAKAAAIPATRGKFRMREEEEEEGSQSWRDSLVDRFFPGSEDSTHASLQSVEKVELKPHNYMDNGLVAVNPHGRHPIFDLLTRSQEAWRKKSAKQSTTLWQAAKEYRKRYQRPPPKGFDQWYVLSALG